MNICIVTYKYPNTCNPSDFVFVKKLVDEFAKQGHKCVVLCPFNCLHYKHFGLGDWEYEANGNIVTVVRPSYISASNFHIGNFHLTSYFRNKVVSKAFKSMLKRGFRPDVVYCHFWSMGLEAYPFAKKMNIPLFVASGESTISEGNKNGAVEDFKDYVRGVICVSTKNKQESIDKGLTIADKCIVAPNAVNDSLFRKMNRDECRKELGIPRDVFIIIFVGSFTNRKGCNRLQEAINSIPEKDVHSIFLGGNEEMVPDCDNIIYSGKVKNEKLPLFLNSADVFVLPTLHEGCCNAIVEAVACGLPIISSNRPFNWDVLDDSNSIMINPESVEEIRDAIVELRDNPEKRESLSKGSINKAKELVIANRARRIIEFMKSRIV